MHCSKRLVCFGRVGFGGGKRKGGLLLGAEERCCQQWQEEGVNPSVGWDVPGTRPGVTSVNPHTLNVLQNGKGSSLYKAGEKDEIVLFDA